MGTGSIVAALRSHGVGAVGERAVLRIPLDQVATHPDNPRHELSEIEGLAGSLKRLGQLQPAVVVTAAAFIAAHPQHAERIGQAAWVIQAGHRRLAALQLAGIDHLEAIEAPDADQVRGYLTFIDENNHRAGLDPLEEASGYSLLVDAGLSQRQIATQLGVSQSQVSKRLGLLRLPDPVQDALRAGKLPVIEALELGAIAAEDQVAVYELARGRNLPIASAIKTHAAEQAQAAALHKVRTKLEKAGEQIVEDPNHEWDYPFRHRLGSRADVETAREAGTLLAHPTATGPVYYTSKPLKQGQSEREQQEKAEQRERSAAMKARTAAARDLARARIPSEAAVLAAVVDATLHRTISHADCLKLAHKWLSDRIGDPNADSAYRWLDSITEDTRDQAPEAQRWLAYAMALAGQEHAARATHSPWGHRQLTYLGLLVENVGYEPTPWEQARLAHAATHAAEGTDS